MNEKSFPSKQKHVIVGNSAAALSAIKAIRESDSRSSITLISAERCFAYSPVLLTYYVGQKIDRESLFIVDRSFYERHKVELILGNKAKEVDPEEQLLHLADGNIVEYDNLLIATGSSPKRLGIEGENLPGVFTLKTLDDADKLLKYSDRMTQVVIIGGGLIGLQAANALFREGRRLTMVIGSKQPLSQNVDPSCAQSICQGIRDCGMSILFESNAVSIQRSNTKLLIDLDSGQRLDADAVIIGKGVNPNIALVEKNGIEVNRGVIVDETMRSNFPNVFAAGDVAEGRNLVSGERQVIATWANACSQGKTAGINMAGGKGRFLGLTGNVCSFLGRTVASVGITKPENGDYEEIVYSDPGKGLYRKLVWNEKGQIMGAVLMGKVEDIGVITNLIRNRARIPKDKRYHLVRSTVKYGAYFSQKTGHFLW
ncbi:MAG: FAD-dependent oxidoreductase [Proteobacteria bacterium]|nr:FAD-dependent oxidoreductase [Pseudomonadota bacterium]